LLRHLKLIAQAYKQQYRKPAESISTSVPNKTAMIKLESRSKAEAVNSAIEQAGSEEYSRDERDLMRLGKKPVLKRDFGFMQVLGFSCSLGYLGGHSSVSGPHIQSA
jgi:hypothetical protein